MKSNTRYLEFVRNTVQTLLDKQSARIGGRPDGTLCITVTQSTYKTWRTIGSPQGNSYFNALVPELPLEPHPTRLDLDIWPVLENLSGLTGDAQYEQLVRGMANAFAEHGFDPRSGLGYLGQETEFDVVGLKPLGVRGYPDPKFKPQADLPLERLWSVAPDKVARMFKAAYYGLITRPETMDYNRFCYFDFDDREKKIAHPFDPQHVAFAQTGAMLIHYWAFHFARTGDRESLSWAKAMADKWSAVQHPRTGLLPHWFGSDDPNDDKMPPRPVGNVHETTTALSLLWAANELRKHTDGSSLAEQVADMARRLLVGIARNGYDPKQRIFPSWLRLEGGADTTSIWYAFPTQAMKDEAVKRDPILQEVAVFAGPGFYSDGPWAMNAHNTVPHDLSLGALLTGDDELLARSVELAGMIMADAARLTGEFNDAGQWLFPANASYLRMMLNLFRRTGEPRYLDRARQLADREIDLLSRPLPSGRPEWWRMPFRNTFLTALLELAKES